MHCPNCRIKTRQIATSLDLLNNFAVSWNAFFPEIISKSNGEIIASSPNPPLLIYNTQGNFLRSINSSLLKNIYDATWTTDGNILYTEQFSGKAVLISFSGELIAHKNFKNPRLLSVSVEGFIYLTDYFNGVYWSTDNGHSWVHLFKPNNTRNYKQAIEVKLGTVSYLWLLEFNNGEHELHVYTAQMLKSDSHKFWDELTDIAAIKKLPVTLFSRLANDGKENVFFINQVSNSIYVFSPEGVPQGPLERNPYLQIPHGLFVAGNDGLLLCGDIVTNMIYVYKINYDE